MLAPLLPDVRDPAVRRAGDTQVGILGMLTSYMISLSCLSPEAFSYSFFFFSQRHAPCPSSCPCFLSFHLTLPCMHASPFSGDLGLHGNHGTGVTERWSFTGSNLSRVSHSCTPCPCADLAYF